MEPVRVAEHQDDRSDTVRDGHADVWAVGAASGLVVLAAVVGGLLTAHGVVIHAGAAPLFAHVDPVLRPGSLAAVAVAVGLVAGAPVAAADWAWPRLLAGAAGATLVWTSVLALVRGPQGLLGPLGTPSEYLADVPRIEAVGSLRDWLTGFAASIPADSADPWTTHVSGHPPGMTLVFVLLDRVGLSGPGPAAAVCLLGWTLAVVCVGSTVRRLAGEEAARAALPYLVCLPAAVWAGVSADALLAGVAALGLYLLSRGTWVSALAGGVVLGVCVFLSYGALLLGPVALAVLYLARGRRLPAVAAAAGVAGVGALAVYATFRGLGFDWFAGYQAVRGRYVAGYGGTRPYAYWAWADFAALTVAAGPVVVMGLRRALSRRPPTPIALLAGSALAAVLLAALSGMSKAEVERIWLPWTVWLAVGCALIPRLPRSRLRRLLALQLVVGLVVEHLLSTPW